MLGTIERESYYRHAIAVLLWIVDTRSAFALLGGLGVLSRVGTIPYSAFYVALAEGLPKNIRGSAFATIHAVSKTAGAVVCPQATKKSSTIAELETVDACGWRRR
jgi:hypothetical protein